MAAELLFRVESFADPAHRAPLLALIHDIFRLDLTAYSALDIWHPGYRAYAYWDGDTIAANVSLRPLTLMMDGRLVSAAQLHAVATRPAFRRRGLFTDLMTRVMEYAVGRFDQLLLFTATCDLYQPFGFRHLPQHRFIGRLDHGGGPAEPAPRRLLSLDDPDDRGLIRALYAARQPVSKIFSVADNADVFFANALDHPAWRLTYLPRQNALIVSDRHRLIDIAASVLPSTRIIADSLGLASPDQEVEIRFPPDRLAGTFRAVPHEPEAQDHLMMRGAYALGEQPIILPPTTLS